MTETRQEQKLPVYTHQLERENRCLQDSLRQAERSFLQHERALKTIQQSRKELKEHAALHHAVLDSAMDGIVSMNPVGQVMDWNAMAEEMFGFCREEVLGKDLCTLIVPPELQEKHRHGLQQWQQQDHQGRAFHVRMETEGRRADGSIFPIELSITKVQLQNSFFFTGFIRNLTARNQATSQLSQSENKYQNLFNNTADMILIFDVDGFILDVNAAELQTLGYAREDLIGKHLLDIVAPEYRPQTTIALQCLKVNMPATFRENMMLSSTGKEIPVEVRATAQQEEGRISSIIAVIRDITERKLVEKKLKDEEVRLRTFIAANPVPTVISSADGGIIRYVNPAAESLLGLTGDQLIGRKNTEFMVFPELREGRMVALSYVNKLTDQEILIKTQDGDELVVLTSLVRIDYNGEPAVLAAMYDISERLRLSGQLSRSLEATIEVIARTEEARDPYTAGHQSRVAALSCALGVAMGLDSDCINGLHWGGMIHDLGKIRLPTEFLTKPTRLSPLEFGLIKEHAQIGYEILKGIDFPWPIADIVRQHHERIDGSGYPQGLKGEQIALESRIVAVADVVEAMANDRPYRSALGIDKALDEIRSGLGIRYDARVAEACLSLFAEKKFSF